MLGAGVKMIISTTKTARLDSYFWLLVRFLLIQ